MDNIEKQKNIDDAALSYRDNVANVNINGNTNQITQNNNIVGGKESILNERGIDDADKDLINLSSLVDEPSEEIDENKKSEIDNEKEKKKKEAIEYAQKKENLIKQLEIKQGIKREDIVDISLLKDEEKEKIKALYPYQLIEDDKDLFVVETRDKDGNPVVGVYTEDGNVVQEQLDINKEGEIASKKEIKKQQKEGDKEKEKEEKEELEEEKMDSLGESEQQELAENEIENSEFGNDIDKNTIRLFRNDNPLYKSNPELRKNYNGIAIARKNDGQFVALARDLQGNWQKMGETNGKTQVSQQVSIDDRFGNSQDFTGKSLYMMKVDINGGPNTLGSYFAFQQEGNKSEYNVSYLRQFTDGTYNGSVMQLQGRSKVDRENNEQIENRDNTSVNNTDKRLEDDFEENDKKISKLDASIIEDNGNKSLIEKQNRFIKQYFSNMAETNYDLAKKCAIHMVDLTEGRNAVSETLAYDMTMKEVAENHKEVVIPEEEQKTLYSDHNGEHKRSPYDV